jgi:hypothetical protein
VSTTTLGKSARVSFGSDKANLLKNFIVADRMFLYANLNTFEQLFKFASPLFRIQHATDVFPVARRQLPNGGDDLLAGQFNTDLM